ncbi:MAG: hypothetical protein P794_08530 [Epsilonproteobacteria bacterium (ex Lamellibrachia satsuma)]|nr:MAG: hypothetical protein P794_08530 [Epsilonproteobacteria bacterium (ex Lamellibrachia satsuma)]
MSQTEEIDEKFYERADAHIALANDHINHEQVRPALVNNSLLYAASRFSAWIAAASFTNAEDLQKEKEDVLDFFTNKYREMLEENFDNYAQNYEHFMGISKEQGEEA